MSVNIWQNTNNGTKVANFAYLQDGIALQAISQKVEVKLIRTT
jgi:S1-C subfamily serine protease